MKDILKLLSPFAPDQSGASGVLYELGGLIVICDAGGCAGNVCGFDEPRWFVKKSAIFSAGLRDMDAILGRDDRLIEKLSNACDQLKPAFTAIIGTPVPAVIATDMRALKRMAEKKTGLPCITAECTGTNYFDKGEEEVWLKLIKTFAKDDLQKEVGKVGIIGAAPLEISLISADAIVAEYEDKGYKNVVCYGMGSGLEDVKMASSCEKNIVISASGIKAAEYLKEKFGTPYEVGFPKCCIGENVFEQLENCGLDGKKVLIIHTQTAANELRKHIKDRWDCQCDNATFFMQKPQLSQPSDVTLSDEDDLRKLCEEGKYDVIIADRTLKRVVKNFEGIFIDFPHFGLSGRLLKGEYELK